ncbi:MAG: M48 family metalloprotease [Coriobacteriia bacterium]|nr:M48 family metalloprotease [Coriobacteriia bacterium]MBN2839546.1 M48 family metalloprotease [Coriobacteriia bacterium]
MWDQISSNKFKSAALIAVFIALVALIGFVFGQVTDWGYLGLVLALGVALAMSVGSYWFSDKIVLSMSRARPVDRELEPYLVNTVEGLSIAAGLPVPRAYVIDDPAPNAFATGRNPENAAVAVTSGLLAMMNRQELEGVLAHELAHIKNYDTLLQTLAAVLAGSVTLISEWMLRSFWWGGRDRNRDSGQLGAILMVVAIVLALLSPLAATLIQMAISRRREFLADASAAMLTRYPPGLASALRKIGGDQNQLRAANKATESLYIVNPLRARGRGMNSLFNTHPPLAERIALLEAM